MDKRGERGGSGREYHKFLWKFCCLRVILRFFRNFPISKKILRTRGICHGSPSKIYCITVLKKILEEPFWVSKSLWCRKSLWIWWGGGTDSASLFSSKVCCDKVPKNFLCCRIFLPWRHFKERRGERGDWKGVSRFPVENLLSHRTKKPSVFQKFTAIEKLYAQEASATVLCRMISVSQYRKHSSWNPSMFRNFSSIENVHA